MKKINEEIISSTLINNYKIEDDKLVITYFDNSRYEQVCSPEYARLVAGIETFQMEFKDYFCDLEEIKKNIKGKQRDIALKLILSALSITAAVLRDELLLRIIFSIITLNTFSNMISYIKEIKVEKQKLLQLQKYSQFVEILKYFTENSDSDLFDGIFYNKHELNIFTLDEYSSKDIDTLHKNVVRGRKK